jgi:hypothetical protein
VSVLDTVVPHAKAYKEAATLRIPVHRHERRDATASCRAPSTVMHQLAWELDPEPAGRTRRRLPSGGAVGMSRQGVCRRAPPAAWRSPLLRGQPRQQRA